MLQPRIYRLKLGVLRGKRGVTFCQVDRTALEIGALHGHVQSLVLRSPDGRLHLLRKGRQIKGFERVKHDKCLPDQANCGIILQGSESLCRARPAGAPRRHAPPVQPLEQSLKLRL